MPGRTSQFSAETNAMIKVELMSTLQMATSADMPTTDWIQRNSIPLAGFTPQKLSRSLNELQEMGIVVKGKNRSGRMVYRLREQMESEGYKFD